MYVYLIITNITRALVFYFVIANKRKRHKNRENLLPIQFLATLNFAIQNVQLRQGNGGWSSPDDAK